MQDKHNNQTMKAIVFHGKCHVELQETPIPIIKHPTDAIIKVSKSGLCGSDMHPYHCREVGIDEGGCIMGHEFCGTVSEIGDQVSNFKIGDRVGSPFVTCCGNCFYCKRGLTARCEKNELFGWVEKGEGLQGAQAQYVRVPMADSTLMAIPDDVSDEEAILLGDIFSTGYFAAENSGIAQQLEQNNVDCVDGHPNTNLVVAVVGCGPVGLMAIIGAKELGASTIYAIDTIAERLDIASSYGAISINAVTCDAVDVVRNATGGRGADIVLEVVGSSSALERAVQLVRPGGTISSCGCHTDTMLPVVQVYNKNLKFVSGRCPARYYMDKLLPLVQSKKYDLTKIITHRMPLTVEAYSLFDKKEDGCVKVIMDPWA